MWLPHLAMIPLPPGPTYPAAPGAPRPLPAAHTLALLATLALIPWGCGSHRLKGDPKHGHLTYDKGKLYTHHTQKGHESPGRLYEGDGRHILLEDDSIDYEAAFKEEQLRMPKMQSVHVSVVRERMQKVRTFHDVLRIFYGYEDLSNDEIESVFLVQQRPRSLHTMAMGPSFGGLPLTEGTRDQHLMLSDAPCDNCDVIIPGFAPSPTSRSHKRRLRKRRQRGRRNRERERKRLRERKSRKRNRKSKNKHKKKKKKKGKGQKAMRLATRHMNEVTGRTSCSEPVPVCVNAREISTEANKMYFPECTIVYQCRKDAGCCPGGHACAPEENDTIRRYFWETEMTTGGKLELGKTQTPIKWFSFVNHTRCGCKPVKSLPQCLMCPTPFVRVDVNVTQCVCDCPTVQKHKTCERIKRGMRALEQQQLRCIKENRCHLPRCRHGDFNIADGYCPYTPAREEDRGGSGGRSREAGLSPGRATPRDAGLSPGRASPREEAFSPYGQETQVAGDSARIKAVDEKIQERGSKIRYGQESRIHSGK